MGYFSSNIPKDHKEAQSHAKKAMAVLQHAVKHPKKMVEGRDYVTSLKGRALKAAKSK